MHFPLLSSAGMLPDKIHPNGELTLRWIVGSEAL
ncbi:hypothetical protein T05_14123 [Trichinella murrelli]|uniref:Uncharacterized protein n=1 Tax=Trichinella murrelli TaxID=144512 RepID=A0A0V0SNM3_9BILA|nr:hypothetical protein T05_14123 [Trichinella murrelli]